MAPNTDDLAFVEKVVNGDREAAELFFYRCQLWAGQLARLSGVPAQDWGDVSQEALIAAVGQMRRGMFRGDSSFQTWVEKIIRGKIADYWRARGSHQALAPPDELIGDQREVTDSHVALIQSLAMRKADQELRLLVREVLKSLPRQHALILILNAREGYSTVEISRKLDLPQGTVGRKLFEAKNLFRRFFHDATSERKTAAGRRTQDEGHRSDDVVINETFRIQHSIFQWLTPTNRWSHAMAAQRPNFITALPTTVSEMRMTQSAA